MILKFLVRSLLFLSVLLIFCFTIQKLVANFIRDSNEFVAATLDKEKRLSELKQAKIVFIGGSNLAFGIDSKKISDSLKMPVVNMAVHAGLGLDFILNESINSIHENDIVVISTEYHLTKAGDTKLIAQLIDLNPSASQYYYTNLEKILKLKVAELQRCASGLYYKLKAENFESVYKRNKYNLEGDMIGHLALKEDNPAVKLGQGETKTIKDYGEELSFFNEIIAKIKAKNAKVYYVFPCFPEEEYQLSKLAIDDFEYQMQRKLKCQIINTPKTFLYDYSNFFDTVYHLNKKGRAKRTDTMIETLSNIK